MSHSEESSVLSPAVTIAHIKPFGAIITAAQSGAHLPDVPLSVLKSWLAGYDLLILRNFAPLEGDTFPDYCSRLGEIAEFSFGAVNNLKVSADAKNYLFTNREVPFHWDGAFVGKIPHWIIFHCDIAPPEGSGGETLFCHTPLLLQSLPEEKKDRWRTIQVTYSTEKLAHYGGSFTSPLLISSPITSEEILRFAEPVYDLNPVSLQIEGLPLAEQPDFLAEMHSLLHDPKFCIAHSWLPGDIVMADNFSLLHGRRAFLTPEQRHLRRVNVL